jgi:hypothetical protein
MGRSLCPYVSLEPQGGRDGDLIVLHTPTTTMTILEIRTEQVSMLERVPTRMPPTTSSLESIHGILTRQLLAETRFGDYCIISLR